MLVLIAHESFIEVGDVRGKSIPVVSAVNDVGALLRTVAGDYQWHDVPLRIEDERLFAEHQHGVGCIVVSGAVSIGVPSF